MPIIEAICSLKVNDLDGVTPYSIILSQNGQALYFNAVRLCQDTEIVDTEDRPMSLGTVQKDDHLQIEYEERSVGENTIPDIVALKIVVLRNLANV